MLKSSVNDYHISLLVDAQSLVWQNLSGIRWHHGGCFTEAPGSCKALLFPGKGGQYAGGDFEKLVEEFKTCFTIFVVFSLLFLGCRVVVQAPSPIQERRCCIRHVPLSWRADRRLLFVWLWFSVSPLSQVHRTVKVEGSKPLRSFIGRFPGGICGVMSSHPRGLTWHDVNIQVYLYLGTDSGEIWQGQRCLGQVDGMWWRVRSSQKLRDSVGNFVWRGRMGLGLGTVPLVSLGHRILQTQRLGKLGDRFGFDWITVVIFCNMEYERNWTLK